ncbi:MAG TPA: hypothetical protein VKA84_15540, partial [Gemmatimonadaceae bacterium]|nr:hypothetical protein [Gemmatimonadaceae bacterium]
PAAAAARAAPARRMLSWARMPYFVVEPQGDGSALVRIDDARYAAGARARSFAAVTVRVTP